MKTKEEKDQYFKQLRESWKQAKELAEDPEYKYKYELLMSQSPSMQISATGFAFCLKSMEENGFEGLPYLDCKTYKGWQESGFIVKRGEHSKIDGITWISSTRTNEKGEDEDGGVYPKAYKLFHASQVEAL